MGSCSTNRPPHKLLWVETPCWSILLLVLWVWDFATPLSIGWSWKNVVIQSHRLDVRRGKIMCAESFRNWKTTSVNFKGKRIIFQSSLFLAIHTLNWLSFASFFPSLFCWCLTHFSLLHNMLASLFLDLCPLSFIRPPLNKRMQMGKNLLLLLKSQQNALFSFSLLVLKYIFHSTSV